MIRSFKTRDTKKLFQRERVKRFHPSIQRVALRKLRNAASRQTPAKMEPVHPGEILAEEFLKPMGLSQNALARGLGGSPRRINEIVHGKRRLTADTALRLAHFFEMSAEFWMGLQMDYELDVESARLADSLKRDVKTYRAS